MRNGVDREANRENFVSALEALVSFEPFPFFGTLLGITRESDVIEGDDDVDVYVEYGHRVGVRTAMATNGFNVTIDTEYFLQFSKSINGIETFVDVYLFENKTDDRIVVDRWNYFGQPSVATRHLHIPTDFIFPLITYSFFGKEILIPQKSEFCCEYLYGKHWHSRSSKVLAEYKVTLVKNSPVVSYRGETMYDLITQYDEFEYHSLEFLNKVIRIQNDFDTLSEIAKQKINESFGETDLAQDHFTNVREKFSRIVECYRLNIQRES